MRRRPTPAQTEARALVRAMNKTSGRTFYIFQGISGYYKGSPRYRYCLAEIVAGRDYKRTRWHSGYASLLDDLRKRAEQHAA